MSGVYIHQPATNGRVLIETTAGPLHVELWSRECPLACRDFVQSCLDNAYAGFLVSRIVPRQYVLCTRPAGSNLPDVKQEGYAIETHSRIRFVKRGMVAMVGDEFVGPSDPSTDGQLRIPELCGGLNFVKERRNRRGRSGSFFMTLGATLDSIPDSGAFTIFGKIQDETNYNLLRMSENVMYVKESREEDADEALQEKELEQCDGNDWREIKERHLKKFVLYRPLEPPRILRTEVLDNPFSDITQSAAAVLAQIEAAKRRKPQVVLRNELKDATKLSFGDDEEDDDDEADAIAVPVAEAERDAEAEEDHLGSRRRRPRRPTKKPKKRKKITYSSLFGDADETNQRAMLEARQKKLQEKKLLDGLKEKVRTQLTGQAPPPPPPPTAAAAAAVPVPVPLPVSGEIRPEDPSDRFSQKIPEGPGALGKLVGKKRRRDAAAAAKKKGGSGASYLELQRQKYKRRRRHGLADPRSEKLEVATLSSLASSRLRGHRLAFRVSGKVNDGFETIDPLLEKKPED